MTQDEYNKLIDKEQNELFATDVLGWVKGKEGVVYYDPIKKKWGFAVKNFDPINNLDHAFMGVEPWHMRASQFQNGWVVTLFEKESQEQMGISHNRNLNKAIMLGCLKANGVVE